MVRPTSDLTHANLSPRVQRDGQLDFDDLDLIERGTVADLAVGVFSEGENLAVFGERDGVAFAGGEVDGFRRGGEGNSGGARGLV